MATNFSPCKGSYVLNQFPSNVMFGMNGFHVSASGAIQGHHGPLVNGANDPYLEKTSMTARRYSYLTPRLDLENASISTKSAAHILSIPLTKTLRLLNSLLIGLCNSFSKSTVSKFF